MPSVLVRDGDTMINLGQQSEQQRLLQYSSRYLPPRYPCTASKSESVTRTQMMLGGSVDALTNHLHQVWIRSSMPGRREPLLLRDDEERRRRSGAFASRGTRRELAEPDVLIAARTVPAWPNSQIRPFAPGPSLKLIAHTQIFSAGPALVRPQHKHRAEARFRVKI